MSKRVTKMAEEETFEDRSPLEREKYIEKLKEDPNLKVLMEGIERSTAMGAKQASDPESTLYRERIPYTAEMFLPYVSTSPTAKCHLQVFQNYMFGCKKLYEYGKENIETEKDCDFLQEAFKYYAWAHMVETIMYDQFHPPANTFALLEEYIKRRPNDVFARYFRVAMIFQKRSPGVLKIEAIKEKIIEAELLVESIRHLSGIKEERMILISTLYLLGSMYSVTNQTERALDSFQKSLDLDPSYLPALYGVAMNKMESDVDGAIKLLHKYLDIAPRCDKKYPNALYQLGACYFMRYQNVQEAHKYYRKGLRAEKERLPFIEKSHADIPAKHTLELMSKLKTGVK